MSVSNRGRYTEPTANRGESLYHSSILDTEVQISPFNLLRYSQLSYGNIAPIPPNVSGIWVSVRRWVVHKIEHSLLRQGWVAAVARRRWNVSLVLNKALSMR